jgi:hypothetical protein
VPGPGLNPVPADGATVVLPVPRLAWDISPVGLRYQVFFGGDSAAVAAATPGSPLQLGEVTGPSIALAAPLGPGQSYFWRVDVVRFSSTTVGAVWRFTVAPIVVAPNSLSVRAMKGVAIARVPLALDGGGPPQSWSVTRSAAWLATDRASGSTPDTLWLSFDASALAAGHYADTLRFAAGDFRFAVPVTLDLIDLDVSRMVTDYDRPYVYALHPGSGLFDDAFLLFVNTNTDQVEKVLPIGKKPTDLAVHAAESRLYVTNWGQPLTRVVDLVTQTELPPLALGTDVYRINAGRAGRIYIEGEDQWVNLGTVNSATGAVLSNQWIREGDGEVDPTGTWYYHCDNNISNAHITRYDITADTPAQAVTSNEHAFGSRNLVISGSGNRLFWRGYVFDAALGQVGHTGAEVYATTLKGDVAFSSSQALNPATGAVLANLPVVTTAMAVSGDQAKLFYFDPATRTIRDTVLYAPVATSVSVAGTEVGPGRVRITWYSHELAGPVHVQRESDAGWIVVGTVSPDGGGMLSFEDLSVLPATHYRYRLAVVGGAGSGQVYGEVALDTPEAPRFALHGLSPNPVVGPGPLLVRLSLPTRADATLAVVDVQGRVVWRRSLAGLDAGEHALPIESASGLRPGVYFVRLEQAGNRATKRFVLVQ